MGWFDFDVGHKFDLLKKKKTLKRNGNQEGRKATSAERKPVRDYSLHRKVPGLTAKFSRVEQNKHRGKLT